MHPAAGPGGGTGHKAHALVAEHRWRLARHDADHRDALPLQLSRLGAGLGGGIDHQPLGRREIESEAFRSPGDSGLPWKLSGGWRWRALHHPNWPLANFSGAKHW